MSYLEYEDLFEKAQTRGLYHIFTFDIVESRKMPAKEREKAQYQIYLLALEIYDELIKRELEHEKSILLKDEGFSKLWESPINKEIGMKTEPFVFGDSFGITTYRDSISNEEFFEIFENKKYELGIEISFHFSDGYYETNKYEEGNKKYFRGYCIQHLIESHKKENKVFKKCYND